MGERKGTNKYYPPDFDPAKHGSLNKYHGSHPLRERARKLSQGILVIRFEMPYNIWCDGCKNHIGMGVRYNAEKRKVGTYYTTPIYRFRMKCHLCVNHIELQTDPAGCDYVIVSGARRKEERWDQGDNGQLLPTEGDEKAKLQSDAMFRLEHNVADRAVLQRAVPTLANLQEAQSAWKDDFGLNSLLRRRFREEKRAQKEEEEEEAALRMKVGLSIPLLPEEEEDRRLAALLKYHSPTVAYEANQRQKRSQISSRSWFCPTARGGPSNAPPPPPPTPHSPSALGIPQWPHSPNGLNDPIGPSHCGGPEGAVPHPPSSLPEIPRHHRRKRRCAPRSTGPRTAPGPTGTASGSVTCPSTRTQNRHCRTHRNQHRARNHQQSLQNHRWIRYQAQNRHCWTQNRHRTNTGPRTTAGPFGTATEPSRTTTDSTTGPTASPTGPITTPSHHHRTHRNHRRPHRTAPTIPITTPSPITTSSPATTP
ncbi:probable splicing factor YJU2B [Gallus gallus]|uniref:probable splicing factor YJU2B n=1 Tax=Gallus gallus TaxID=9031 RepID=UPI001F011BDC|nr:probable splicing factor YJU2B [Gallus gallus]